MTLDSDSAIQKKYLDCYSINNYFYMDNTEYSVVGTFFRDGKGDKDGKR